MDNADSNTVSMTTAEALQSAINGSYDLVDGSGLSSTTPPFGSLSYDKLDIEFNGTAAGHSSVETSFSVVYTQNSCIDANNSSTSSPTASECRVTSSSGSSARTSSDLNTNHTDLNHFDTSKLDGLGVSHTFHKSTRGNKTISGTGHTYVVYASKKEKHHFSSFKDSYLHDKSDKFVFSKNDSGNSIFALGGRDTVKSASSQTAHLGDGDDVYKISSNSDKGSLHQIFTGNGEDKLAINSPSSKFIIADFHPFDDIIKVGKSLDSNLLSAKLTPHAKGAKVIDNATIDFKYDGKHIGTAHLEYDSDLINSLIDPVTHHQLYALNIVNCHSKSMHEEKDIYDMFNISVKNGTAYSGPMTSEKWDNLDTDSKFMIIKDYNDLAQYNHSSHSDLFASI